MKEELEELASSRNISSVEFVGYAPYDKMAAYLKASDVLVNSFVRKAPQSIVTKIGDYLAAGKPMVNTCMSPEFRAKVEHDGFGINIEPEDVISTRGCKWKDCTGTRTAAPGWDRRRERSRKSSLTVQSPTARLRR